MCWLSHHWNKIPNVCALEEERFIWPTVSSGFSPWLASSKVQTAEGKGLDMEQLVVLWQPASRDQSKKQGQNYKACKMQVTAQGATRHQASPPKATLNHSATVNPVMNVAPCDHEGCHQKVGEYLRSKEWTSELREDIFREDFKVWGVS